MRMKRAWHVRRTGEKTNAYRVLAGKTEERRSVGRRRRRWEDYIRMDFKEIRLEGVDWIRVAKDIDN
jgi:hypothetical protein